jgi:hypothetical protein
MSDTCVKCGLVRPTYISEPTCPRGGYHDYQEQQQVTSMPDGTVKQVPLTCPSCGAQGNCNIIFSETHGVTVALPKHWWATVKTGSSGGVNNDVLVILFGCTKHKPA